MFRVTCSSAARSRGAEGPQIDVRRGWLPGENLGAGTFPPMASTCLSFLIMIPLGLAHRSNNDITATLSNCAPTVPGRSWMLHPNPQEKVLANSTNLEADLVRILAPREPWEVTCLHWDSVFSSVKWV